MSYNILDNYEGSTLNDKIKSLFLDINTNKKNTPMVIELPSGIIEITEDLKAIGWTNKIFRCDGILYFKGCNAFEFIKCQHNNIYIHRLSSEKPTIDNPQGFIPPTSVASLTKTGLKFSDCNYNYIKVNTILGFKNGVEWFSQYGAIGCCYNTLDFVAIWRCKQAMKFYNGKASDDTSITQSGWVTQIYVNNGKFDCDDGIVIGQDLADRPANEPTDNYQGIIFEKVGVEHVRLKENGVGFNFKQGKNNAIINPRFEGSLLGGNTTSGAYILVKESGYACNNRVVTSNYPINVDRVMLNFLAKQLANPAYDNPAGSFIEGDLYDNAGYKCGYKAIATTGKMVYEARNLSNYYLQNSKINTFNYVFSDTEFAKIKDSNGNIKTIRYSE